MADDENIFPESDEVTQESPALPISEVAEYEEPPADISPEEKIETENDLNLRNTLAILKEITNKLCDFLEKMKSPKNGQIEPLVLNEQMSFADLDSLYENVESQYFTLSCDSSKSVSLARDALNSLKTVNPKPDELYILFDSICASADQAKQGGEDLLIMQNQIRTVYDARARVAVSDFNQMVDGDKYKIVGDTSEKMGISARDVYHRVSADYNGLKNQKLTNFFSAKQRHKIDTLQTMSSKLYQLNRSLLEPPRIQSLPDITELSDKILAEGYSKIQSQFGELYSQHQYSLNSLKKQIGDDEIKIIKQEYSDETFCSLLEQEQSKSESDKVKYKENYEIFHNEELVGRLTELASQLPKIDWNDNSDSGMKICNDFAAEVEKLPSQFRDIIQKLPDRRFYSDANLPTLLFFLLNHFQIARTELIGSENISAIKSFESVIDQTNNSAYYLQNDMNRTRKNIIGNKEEIDRLFVERDLDEWTYLRNIDAIKKYGEMNIKEAEHFLANRISELIIAGGYHNVSYKGNIAIRSFKCAEAIPVVLIESLKMLSKHQMYDASWIYEYLAEIPREELIRLAKMGNEELATMLAKGQLDEQGFERYKLKNPQIVAFEENLRNDDLIQKEVFEQMYGQKEEDFSDGADQAVSRDPIELTPARIEAVRKFLANISIQRSHHDDEVVSLTENTFYQKPRLRLGDKIFKMLLEKYGFQEEIYDTPTVDSPIFAESKSAVYQYCQEMAAEGDTSHKIYAIDSAETFLGETADLSDGYRAVINSLGEKPDDKAKSFCDACLEKVLGQSEDFDQRVVLKKFYDFTKYALGKTDSETVAFLLANCPTAITKESLHKVLIENVYRLKSLPVETLEHNLGLILKMIQSPSQEMQKIMFDLISQIMKSQDPEGAYDKISQVFERNNLPQIAKVFLIFQVLHGERTFDKKVESVFGAKTELRRKDLFYSDLLKVHARGGNRSLYSYLKLFNDGLKLSPLLENDSAAELDASATKQLDLFLRRLEAMFENSALGLRSGVNLKRDDRTPAERFAVLKKSLRVREDQTVQDRIVEMFLKPLGLSSIKEVLDLMRDSITEADRRNRSFVESGEKKGSDVYLDVKEGDFFKGIDQEYIDNILQNGSVAKEFLGSGSSSDGTPLDTDMARVREADTIGGFTDALNKSMAKGYGNGLYFVLRDRGQYTDKPEDSGKYQVIDHKDPHYGVRTGFPATEVDFIVLEDSQINQSDKLFYSIAKNGYYIPVTDTAGKVIFSPEQFDKYKKAFDGIEFYYGNPLKVIAISELENVPGEVKNKLKTEFQSIREKRDHEGSKIIMRAIEEYVRSLLEEFKIEQKEKIDQGLLGAEFMETGSTSRGTNNPGDFDFDFALRLDDQDYISHKDSLVERIKSGIHCNSDNSHSENGYYQISLKGVNAIDGKSINEILGGTEMSAFDVDLGISKKSELVLYASHDAVSDKLDYIRDNMGTEALAEVQANVVLAKQVLKSGSCYKKLDGGFGGIGTENWILANDGNAILAFQSFMKAAAGENGDINSFYTFQDNYRLLSAGMNIKFAKEGKNEDFIHNLHEEGYSKMFVTIGKWLRGNNIT
jgi:hypothetical protein